MYDLNHLKISKVRSCKQRNKYQCYCSVKIKSPFRIQKLSCSSKYKAKQFSAELIKVICCPSKDESNSSLVGSVNAWMFLEFTPMTPVIGLICKLIQSVTSFRCSLVISLQISWVEHDPFSNWDSGFLIRENYGWHYTWSSKI